MKFATITTVAILVIVLPISLSIQMTIFARKIVETVLSYTQTISNASLAPDLEPSLMEMMLALVQLLIQPSIPTFASVTLVTNCQTMDHRVKISMNVQKALMTAMLKVKNV